MVCMRGWGNKIKDKIQKDQNPISATYEELEINQGVGSKSKILHTLPALNTPKGWQTTEATPLAQPLDTPLPLPHIRNQFAPAWRASKGNIFVLAPLCCSRDPN